LAALRESGQPVPDWTLGGGTALMLAAGHRLSKDIDAFIDDPQYLSILSPDVTDVWTCPTWDKAANYLKLRYPEGEIDFIITTSCFRPAFNEANH
jgi:nucleotidyltransferase AbiEii toxin of type IV toxin-antitoxin system